MEEHLIVDRIVGTIAVCEGEGRMMREIPLTELPGAVKEGDCLRLDGGAYILDPEETQRRRAANLALLQKLKNRGKKKNGGEA